MAKKSNKLIQKLKVICSLLLTRNVVKPNANRNHLWPRHVVTLKDQQVIKLTFKKQKKLKWAIAIMRKS